MVALVRAAGLRPPKHSQWTLSVRWPRNRLQTDLGATLYFPPLKVISRVPGTVISELITLPRAVVVALLRQVFSGDKFDPEWYRTTYPDIVVAIEQGAVADELTHFICFGYFEGRKPRNFDVDSRWYEDTYQDVSKAIRAGTISDARSHFNQTGYFEPRAPDSMTATAFADILAAAAGNGPEVHMPRRTKIEDSVTNPRKRSA
jgi:hypothetical protein